ncbi:hypothetical protein Cgig2_014109 [Carnegiea gigantea]|uniref:FAS1 domain-containing protein n=1 Tax=Carnegiea gigantea TaxID=171969 RepID=A0A9Q1KZF5_9CARY|nr:hypothetical protein Cgig2_014109 [Carnegiea gigantea]
MAPAAFDSVIVILSIILISATSISGFNITRLLDNHPEFSTFNELLSKSGVADAINKRKTITVLVVADSDLGDLPNKPPSSIKNILATHVILDYFDELKLADLSKKTALLTNLFQSSGIANKEQGFLNVTTSGGEVVFGSAIKGAPHDSKMVKTVAAQPYTISVIQISKPIIAPGLDQSAPISPSSPKAALAPVAHSPPKKSGGEDDESSTNEEAAEGPEAEGPSSEEAEGPEAEDDLDSPSPAPEPAADDEAADDSEPKLAQPKNAGSRVAHMGAAMVAGFMGLAIKWTLRVLKVTSKWSAYRQKKSMQYPRVLPRAQFSLLFLPFLF